MNEFFPSERTMQLAKQYLEGNLEGEEFRLFTEAVRLDHERLINTLQNVLNGTETIRTLDHLCALFTKEARQIYFYMLEFPDVHKAYDNLEEALAFYTEDIQMREEYKLIGEEEVKKVIPPFITELRNMPLPKQVA